MSCPHDECPSRSVGGFRCIKRGSYKRACDNRLVQRFRCASCRRHFSEQTFRIDYRLRLPTLHWVLMRDFVSKVSHRQSARTLGCDRKTVAHRLRLLGRHCRGFHEAALARACSMGLRSGRFQLDELQTHEERRLLQPLTLPLLVQRPAYFVVGASVGTLPSRGRLSAREIDRKADLARSQGRRRCESRAAVRETLGYASRMLGPDPMCVVESNCKATYPRLICETLGRQAIHARFPARRVRNRRDPLFPVRQTLAMLRDGISRLVRHSWAAAKRRARLLDHLWIWIAWRNYVRPITNRCPGTTPAMALGLMDRPLTVIALTTWRASSDRSPGPRGSSAS